MITAGTLAKAILVACWVLTLFMANAIGADTPAADADYEKRLRELNDAIGQLQQQLLKTKGSRDNLQQLLRKSEVDIGELNKKIDAIKGALASEKKQLAQLHAERLQLASSRDRQQKHIIDIVNAAYRLGRQGHIKILLNQQQPSQTSRLLRYHKYFIQARLVKIHNYMQTIRQLEQLEVSIADSAKALESQHQRLKKRYRELRDRQSSRLSVLAQLNTDMRDKSQHVSELIRDQQHLQRLLDEATASLADITLSGDATLFKRLRGKLPRPAIGKVLHAYGSRRSSGRLVWNGIFYDSNPGSHVMAVHYGRVIFSDYLKGHGLLLIIDHGDGYMSLYAHNQALYKEIGDWVKSKEVIAAVGNSGGLEHAGLYFEIRYRGRPQDPSRWLEPSS